MPSVNRLYQELRDQGLEARLIAFREDPDLVRRTVRARGYVIPTLLDATGDVTGRVYGVWGPPTVYLIDRQGRLLARGVGPRDWSTPEARRLLESLLRG